MFWWFLQNGRRHHIDLACCYIFISQVVLMFYIFMLLWLFCLGSDSYATVYKYSKHAVQKHNELPAKVAMFEFNDSLQTLLPLGHLVNWIGLSRGYYELVGPSGMIFEVCLIALPLNVTKLNIAIVVAFFCTSLSMFSSQICSFRNRASITSEI